uniref:Uncharacterized protein n=1 Tax=Gadus morhua TaxID=8049 RepID=A0A8C5BVP8_GADMO
MPLRDHRPWREHVWESTAESCNTNHLIVRGGAQESSTCSNSNISCPHIASRKQIQKHAGCITLTYRKYCCSIHRRQHL